MSNKVQTNNGRIVIHDPKWYQSGANLPAVQQRQHIVTDHDRRIANIRPGNTLYRGGHKHSKIIGLKLVYTDAQARKFHSTYHNGWDRQEYHIGRQYVEDAQPHHGGGYYLFTTNDPYQFTEAINAGIIVNDIQRGDWLGIIRCEGWGPYVAYDVDGRTIPFGQWSETKKLACSRLRVVELVNYWQV